MSSVQVTGVCKSGVIFPNRAQLQSVPCTASRTSVKLNATTSYKPCALQLKLRQQRRVVCVLGGKDKSEDEKRPWEAFGKSMGNLKGQSIEDLLRQQIEKKEFYNGSGGKKPPRGGGGGGNGSGESGDETGKRILATIFVILVYICFIDGVELIRLTNDYIKYLFRGKKSVRLKNAMYKWERFWKTLSEKLCDMFRLEINTSTWFDCSKKYKRLLRSYISSQNASE